MNRTISIVMACAVALALAAPRAHADAHEKKKADATKPAMQTDAAHDAAMEEWKKNAMPSKAHAGFKSWVGKWKAVTKAWSAPGEPTVTEGWCENSLILGGRYVAQKFHGTMWGQPFEGHGLTGYDNKRGVYTMTWVDDASTELTSATGTMDAAGKTLTFVTTADGPDGKPQPMIMVTKFVSPNEHVFTMHLGEGEQAMKIMEITYTRM